MFDEIRRLPNDLGADMLDNDIDTLGILLGKSLDGYTIEKMEMIWLTAGKSIDCFNTVETVEHTFFDCIHVRLFWNEIENWLKNQ